MEKVVETLQRQGRVSKQRLPHLVDQKEVQVSREESYLLNGKTHWQVMFGGLNVARRPRKQPVGVIPANITRAEQQRVLGRIDGQLAKKAHHYSYQIVHGGSQEEKERTRQDIKRLELERKSVSNMVPQGHPEGSHMFVLPGHVARAERER